MKTIFGAKAKVFLKCIDEMDAVSKKISKGLMLKDFTVDLDKYPPYEFTGSGEALGFDLWLNKATAVEGYNYEFEMKTALSHDEVMNDRMYDLSLWMAKFISTFCDLDTCVLGQDGNIFFFSKPG